jgi:hypothetical protein
VVIYGVSGAPSNILIPSSSFHPNRHERPSGCVNFSSIERVPASQAVWKGSSAPTR